MNGLHQRDPGCCARFKKYPDGTVELMVCSKPVFRGPGWEPERPQPRSEANHDGDDKEAAMRSVRRARAKVRELALCTSFRWFVTLTLDAKKVDRYNMDEVVKRMRIWLDNRVRRKGLAYVLVPEHHKDGAIHFHGFFNDALPAVYSGHKTEYDRKVYNLPDWDFGFTTAIELYGEYSRAIGYVCKYIGKDLEKGKVGGRWYYSGGVLARPEAWVSDMFSYQSAWDALGGCPGVEYYGWEVPEIGAAFRRFTWKDTENVISK